MLLVCSSGARAGDLSWTHEAVSSAINYADRDVAVRYAAADRSKGLEASRAGENVVSSGGSTPRITSVHARFSYSSDAQVQSALCWNGSQRCVPLSGAAMTTREFNGLDAGKPLYMVHRVKGHGPLATPLFVKGSVIVWFQE